MRYLARFSPVVAIRDLRLFLSQRRPHELWFGLLSVAITGVLLVGFVIDSRVERPPERRAILYVESWPMSRTDREIIDQQKRDMIVRDAQEAEIRKERLARQRQFKQLDDRLEALGL